MLFTPLAFLALALSVFGAPQQSNSKAVIDVEVFGKGMARKYCRCCSREGNRFLTNFIFRVFAVMTGNNTVPIISKLRLARQIEHFVASQ